MRGEKVEGMRYPYGIDCLLEGCGNEDVAFFVDGTFVLELFLRSGEAVNRLLRELELV